MKFHSFTVMPTTPKELAPLLEMANNLWFSWNWDARNLFAQLDGKLWIEVRKNPLKMLCALPKEKLEAAAKNEDYVADVEAVYAAFKKYMDAKTWFQDQHGTYEQKKPVVAYFSCEFGIHESLPIYSGGLGILAGDHLKSASDLGVPLVAVGLLYRQGYFHQGLNENGDQQEFYTDNDWFTMPVFLEKDTNDKPILCSIDLAGETVYYNVWRVEVGRIKLYLLDTNIPENKQVHRDITKRLYDADRDTRIRQEILLGIGGVRALKALSYQPSMYHINEGHSAFLILERLRQLTQDERLSLAEAKEVIAATNLFTNHTPVPAGNERFHSTLIDKYILPYAKNLGVERPELYTWGREVPENQSEDFCLTVLALKFSAFNNGVSALHGIVSREMWEKIYPEVPRKEVPIAHVTNGVHTKTWLSHAMESLFMRYLKTAYVPEIADFTVWNVAKNIPDSELWGTHVQRKERLITFMRDHVRWQLKRRGGSAAEIMRADKIFDKNVLTIGFARRFAPYKRGDMIFSDPDRLAKILNDSKRPIQIVFSGKSHPADMNGKKIIKNIIEIASRPEFKDKVCFLEDYDIDIARYLVQGVDVWLNNPRRPHEASGTSGMKAAMNGALNLSILDGWWEEAFNFDNGWAIGSSDDHYENLDAQDQIEANLIYRLLETEIAPLYYNQDANGIPVGWVQMMKNTIKSCGAGFNAHRMVSDYISKYYVKGAEYHNRLYANSFAAAKDLAKWRERVIRGWSSIKVVEMTSPAKEIMLSGEELTVEAKVSLGDVSPDNLIVEVFHGPCNSENWILDPARSRMTVAGNDGSMTIFKAKVPCNRGGHYGYTVRIIPGHKDQPVEFFSGLIKWA